MGQRLHVTLPSPRSYKRGLSSILFTLLHLLRPSPSSSPLRPPTSTYQHATQASATRGTTTSEETEEDSSAEGPTEGLANPRGLPK
jgi:hypothetical protein